MNGGCLCLLAFVEPIKEVVSNEKIPFTQTMLDQMTIRRQIFTESTSALEMTSKLDVESIWVSHDPGIRKRYRE
jgi:hypothetical protein